MLSRLSNLYTQYLPNYQCEPKQVQKLQMKITQIQAIAINTTIHKVPCLYTENTLTTNSHYKL